MSRAEVGVQDLGICPARLVRYQHAAPERKKKGGAQYADRGCENPYKGKTYKEVDMSGAAELTVLDMAAAENELAAAGHVAAEPALDYLYCCLMAARASGMDKEFFTGMPIAEATHIKNAMNSNRFFE